MSKRIFYQILFFANIIISALLIVFSFLAHLTGMKLVLTILMAITTTFGAIAMRTEMHKLKQK